jgi:hypothetical protein
LNAKSDGQVGFAGSGRAQEDDVVGFSEEVKLLQMADLGSAD